VIRARSFFSSTFSVALAILLTSHSNAQTIPADTPQDNSQPKLHQQSEPPPSSQSQYEKAEQEIKQEEQQRILGLIPNFNTSNLQDAAPLTPGQKFGLALRSSIDPFQFVAAGLDAGYSQAVNDFPGYGQGALGYGKRFGAAYADQVSGTIWGNAIFPTLLHEDSRYFRKGSGSIKRRLLYSISTAVWAKRDNGTWGPNYANVLGNLAAGGLANLYYPSTDRGAGLTFQRAFTVTAEGMIGAAFVEFWPDISRHFHRQRNRALPISDPAPK
jgi:hypothetical protein